jgi:hypothetical protein
MGILACERGRSITMTPYPNKHHPDMRSVSVLTLAKWGQLRRTIVELNVSGAPVICAVHDDVPHESFSLLFDGEEF